MIPEAERESEALDYDYGRLRRYRSRENIPYYEIREDVSNIITHLRNGRELLINAFRDRIFPLRDPAFYPQYRDPESDDDESDDGNNGSNDSSESNDSDNPPRNGEPSGSNNSRSLAMSNTSNSSKYYSPSVYKYFGENSLMDINKN